MERKISFKVGDKVWFPGEKRPYRVKACDDRFAICTKPHNPQKTVLYTIIDLDQNVRGTENLIFCMGFETIELCKEALVRLQDGETEVSFRNRVPLVISKHEAFDGVENLIEVSLTIHRDQVKRRRLEYEIREQTKHTILIVMPDNQEKKVQTKKLGIPIQHKPARIYGGNDNGAAPIKYKVWCYPDGEEAAWKALKDRMHEIADVFMKKAVEFKDVCLDLDEPKRCNGACHDNSAIVGFTKCECEAK